MTKTSLVLSLVFTQGCALLCNHKPETDLLLSNPKSRKSPGNSCAGRSTPRTRDWRPSCRNFEGLVRPRLLLKTAKCGFAIFQVPRPFLVNLSGTMLRTSVIAGLVAAASAFAPGAVLPGKSSLRKFPIPAAANGISRMDGQFFIDRYSSRSCKGSGSAALHPWSLINAMVHLAAG